MQSEKGYAAGYDGRVGRSFFFFDFLKDVSSRSLREMCFSSRGRAGLSRLMVSGTSDVEFLGMCGGLFLFLHFDIWRLCFFFFPFLFYFPFLLFLRSHVYFGLGSARNGTHHHTPLFVCSWISSSVSFCSFRLTMLFFLFVLVHALWEAGMGKNKNHGGLCRQLMVVQMIMITKE